MVADLALFLGRQHPIREKGIGTLAEQRHAPRLTEPLPGHAAERSGAREAIGHEIIVECDIKPDHGRGSSLTLMPAHIRRANSSVLAETAETV